MQLAEEEEITHQRTELEGVCNPIITKLYQGGAVPPEAAGGAPASAAGGQGPTIEEVGWHGGHAMLGAKVWPFSWASL